VTIFLEPGVAVSQVLDDDLFKIPGDNLFMLPGDDLFMVPGNDFSGFEVINIVF
jgi:hypothetical protein